MKLVKRSIAILMVIIIVVGMMSISASALDYLSLSAADAKKLLNSVELHPQRTGYKELDEVMASILAPYNNADTYTKVKGAYDWLIWNVKYSWEPYSQNYAPAYDCFKVIHNLTYEKDLQESAPFEICNRSYHAMKFKEGVCYDYAAAMALLLRYIGIDAFVHTGTYWLEDPWRTPCHHGWTDALINGQHYIIDPQREWRLSDNGRGPSIAYEYFIIPLSAAWRYAGPEYEINAARDAKFLPVAAERACGCKITALSTASGTTSGSAYCKTGTDATVTVTPTGDREFVGWYDSSAQLLSNELNYTFTVTGATTVYAVFDGEYFVDVPQNAWYYDNANKAGEMEIINGIRPYEFCANDKLSRAMAVTILGHAVKADMPSGKTPFTDVSSDSWYSGAVLWANQQGIVLGISEDQYAPNANVTREQFVAMLMRLVDCLGKTPELAELNYKDSDKISAYAVVPMQKAASIGLISGYEDGTIRPQNNLTRGEAVALVVRLVNWLDA